MSLFGINLLISSLELIIRVKYGLFGNERMARDFIIDKRRNWILIGFTGL